MPTNSTTTLGTTPDALELEVELGPLVKLEESPKSEPLAAALEVELEPSEAPAVTAETSRQELVPIYMLAMHLPSPDLIADDYTDTGDGVVRRVKEWRGDLRRVARVIENMRRGVYRKIERLWCLVREFGVWITVSEEGVREAERLMKEVRDTLQKIGLGDVAHRYYVKAVKMYLEPQDAKMILDAAVSQLSSEIRELERRIKDAVAAQNRRQVSELMRKKEYAAALMNIFKKYIESISR